MVHSIVLKFEKIWLNGTLIIIRKPKVWRTNEHEDPYIPPRLSSSGGIKIYVKKNNLWFTAQIIEHSIPLYIVLFCIFI